MAFYKTFYYSTFICVTLFSFSCYSLAKEFTIIALDDFNGIEQIKFQDKSSSQKVSVRKFSSNRSFPIPDSKVIHFYAVDPKTKISSNKPLFKISFEDQKNECIVFLTKDKNKPEKISYEFLNFDTKSFPKVSTFMINLTNQKVSITEQKISERFEINSYKKENMLNGYDDIVSSNYHLIQKNWSLYHKMKEDLLLSMLFLQLSLKIKKLIIFILHFGEFLKGKELYLLLK